jgi:cytochrome b involved in lipid metabolism
MVAASGSHARLMLRLLVCGCCAALAAGLRAASATVRYRASEESFHSGEPLYDSVLRFGAAAAGLALAVQLALDWAPAVDPLLKVEAAELAEPTVTEGAELLTLREDGGVTKAVPLYPKVPNRLSGAPLPQFTMAEVAEHGTRADCWVVLDGRAYDVTKFIDAHPGGVGPVVNMAGKDATDVFDNYHAARVYKTMLTPYLVGEVTDVPVYPHVADFRKVSGTPAPACDCPGL